MPSPFASFAPSCCLCFRGASESTYGQAFGSSVVSMVIARSGVECVSVQTGAVHECTQQPR
eukprot:14864873-Alexandrium_andersonii.AAC.1